MKEDDDLEPTCENEDDGLLVFAPREALTDKEKERADLHLGNCAACRLDMDAEYFLTRVGRENNKAVRKDGLNEIMPSEAVQLSFPFTEIEPNQQGTKKSENVIRKGNPAIPVKMTDYGTYIAKLEHIWRAARQYARDNGYNVMETYGVMGVAPFQEHAVGAWLGYLQVPYKPPVEVIRLYNRNLSMVAEWSRG